MCLSTDPLALSETLSSEMSRTGSSVSSMSSGRREKMASKKVISPQTMLFSIERGSIQNGITAYNVGLTLLCKLVDVFARP